MGLVRRRSGDWSWDGVAPREYETGAERHTLIGAAEGARDVELRYFRIPAGGASALESHHHEHAILILHGRAEALLGEEVAEVGPGDAVFVASQEPHRLTALGDEPLGFLCTALVEPGPPMRESLAPGIAHELRFVVPVTKTVPHLYPESPGFAAMPEVLATGFMVGLVEWACVDAIAPHLDDGEMSLGVHVDLSHDAATPPGLEVTVRVRLEEVDGRRLTFAAEADDGPDRICAGRHVRFIVDRARFEAGVARKAAGG